MIIGHTIFSKTSGDQEPSARDLYYSPGFPREGNWASFACDIVDSEDIDLFEVEIQTKNSEDSDKDSTNLGTNSVTLTDGLVTTFSEGAALGSSSAAFKELVRYQYKLQLSEFASFGWVHFRMLDPSWLTNGA